MVYTEEQKKELIKVVNQALEKDTVDLADAIVSVYKIIWKLQGSIKIPIDDENKIRELIIGTNRQGYNRGIEDAKRLFMTFIG